MLTFEERKDQANKNKATAGKKRQQAYPGDRRLTLGSTLQ